MPCTSTRLRPVAHDVFFYPELRHYCLAGIRSWPSLPPSLAQLDRVAPRVRVARSLDRGEFGDGLYCAAISAGAHPYLCTQLTRSSGLSSDGCTPRTLPCSAVARLEASLE